MSRLALDLQQVMRTLAGFVHPRHTSPAIIDDVMALNRRIKAALDPQNILNPGAVI